MRHLNILADHPQPVTLAITIAFTLEWLGVMARAYNARLGE